MRQMNEQQLSSSKHMRMKSHPKMAQEQAILIPTMSPNMCGRPENGFKVHVDEKCEQ